MSVEINFTAIEKNVPAELVEKIKHDVKCINEDPFISDIQKFMINDSEYYTVIGICTEGLINIYRYDKRRKDFSKKSLSISDYWFIEEMLKGGS